MESTHVRFGGRARETDPGQPGHRARARPNRLHNAADQIRGEGATLQFFSNRQFRNPMVVRIAGYGYQKGFGGHFHNDNAIAALRDIPASSSPHPPGPTTQPR